MKFDIKEIGLKRRNGFVIRSFLTFDKNFIIKGKEVFNICFYLVFCPHGFGNL